MPTAARLHYLSADEMKSKKNEHQLLGISIHRASNYQPAGAANSRAVSDVTRAISISVVTELGIWDLGTLETRSAKHLDSG